MTPVRLQRISYSLRGFSVIAKTITLFIRLVYGPYLPYNILLGKDFTLGYGGIGIVLHDRTVVGNDVHIDQNVTIGGTSKKYGVPKIGNHVYVGAGAVLIGPINIGDNVVIGANAVVISDVPSGSLVVGVPGRVVKSNICKSDYI
jgi:serine O-acetyltransferase